MGCSWRTRTITQRLPIRRRWWWISVAISWSVFPRVLSAGWIWPVIFRISTIIPRLFRPRRRWWILILPFTLLSGPLSKGRACIWVAAQLVAARPRGILVARSEWAERLGIQRSAGGGSSLVTVIPPQIISSPEVRLTLGDRWRRCRISD